MVEGPVDEAIDCKELIPELASSCDLSEGKALRLTAIGPHAVRARLKDRRDPSSGLIMDLLPLASISFSRSTKVFGLHNFIIAPILDFERRFEHRYEIILRPNHCMSVADKEVFYGEKTLIKSMTAVKKLSTPC